MKLAYTMAQRGSDTDQLIEAFATDLIARGENLAGTVQINSEHPDRGPCDMDVTVLPEGPVIRISQSLGSGAVGCRLNPEALENAVGLTESRLKAGVDVLIVNKFGKHEIEGRGFRPLIAEALDRGIPVLVGLNAANLDGFLAYSGEAGEEVRPDMAHLLEWYYA
jgi:hypothetical protein